MKFWLFGKPAGKRRAPDNERRRRKESPRWFIREEPPPVHDELDDYISSIGKA